MFQSTITRWALFGLAFLTLMTCRVWFAYADRETNSNDLDTLYVISIVAAKIDADGQRGIEISPSLVTVPHREASISMPTMNRHVGAGDQTWQLDIQTKVGEAVDDRIRLAATVKHLFPQSTEAGSNRVLAIEMEIDEHVQLGRPITFAMPILGKSGSRFDYQIEVKPLAGARLGSRVVPSPTVR